MSRTIKEWQEEIHEWAMSKGWDFDFKDTPEKIALMHSELSEALEEYRKGNTPNMVYYADGGYWEHGGPRATSDKPEGLGVELADCVIRILQYCGKMNVDLDHLIEVKMQYNHTRPYRHGKVV